MTLYAVADDDRGWLSAVISGTLSGAIFGPIMGWWSMREQTHWRTAAGVDLSHAELKVVHRATSNGPVPSAPRLRAAAVRAAAFSLSKRNGEKKQAAAFVLIFPVVIVLMSVFDSPWWLIAAPPLIYAGHDMWAEPRRLRSRIELLSREPEQRSV